MSNPPHYEQSALSIYGDVVVDDQTAVPASFSNIVYAVYRHVPGGTDVQTAVGALNPNEVIKDPPEEGGGWTHSGTYNFLFVAPASGFPEPADYEIVVQFTSALTSEKGRFVWPARAMHAPPSPEGV